LAEPARVRTWIRRLAILPPLLIGIAVLAFAVRNREPPEQTFVERATPVRTIVVPEVTLVPRALGYGTVVPGREWKAVAQVDGRVIERQARLETGEVMPAGAVLLRIDPSDYRLAVAEIEANLRGAEAELTEIDVRKANLQSSIAIERRMVEIAERDLARKKRLLARGNISPAQVDSERQDLLAKKQKLQELENTLNLIPAERGVLEAKHAQSRARLEVARLDLERTTVTAPFTLRVGPVHVETDQFVRKGEVMAEGSGIAVAEIAAQIPIDRLASLIPPEFDPGTITPETLATISQQLGFDAVVRLRTGRLEASWRARFSRLGHDIDTRTRTIGMIVSVDEPYRKAKPGLRPALVKGMFVEVELRGKPRPGVLVLPRAALHVGAPGETVVYAVEGGKRLRRRPVTVGLGQGDFVTIVRGLAAGEPVVVSDPVPAIDGMLLDPVRDAAAEARLRAQAEGGTG
jgi:multidrug efflux pump subunit AcrA (membrane-fusion protein)